MKFLGWLYRFSSLKFHGHKFPVIFSPKQKVLYLVQSGTVPIPFSQQQWVREEIYQSQLQIMTTLHLLLLLLLVCVCPIKPLAARAAVDRVAVVGGGVAGLALASALANLKGGSGVTDVVIYETRDNVLQSNLGGGVQLSGGAAVMAQLGMLSDLKRVGQKVDRVLARNYRKEQLLDIDVEMSVRLNALDELMVDGETMFFSIMRDALLNMLYNSTQQNQCKTVTTVRGRSKCVGLVRSDDSSKVGVLLSDGSVDEGYDLVFGADGINSVVREYTSGGDKPLVSLPRADPAAPAFTGIRITYALTGPDDSFSLRPGGKGAFHQWFGDGCYCLAASYGGLTGAQHMLAFVYDEAAFSEGAVSRDENAQWREAGSSVDGAAKATLKERLLRGGFGDNEELMRLADASDSSRCIDLSVADRTVPLQSWSATDGRVVLLGDSAHAMAPFLGQGANQALQDALFLARGIGALNSRLRRPTEGGAAAEQWLFDKELLSELQELSGSYELRRKPPTALLSLKSSFLGRVETLSGGGGMFARDNFFRAMAALGIAERIFIGGAKPQL